MPATAAVMTTSAPKAAPLTTAAAVRKAMLEKLAGSKLDERDAKKLRFEPLLAEQLKKHDGLPMYHAGFVIPYFDLRGKPTKFFRFRYLEYGKESGFAALTDKKPMRYGQQAKTLNEIYIPPLFNWETYAPDAGKPLIITEGELKAACATKHGWPTIALGGVWCFKSAERRMPLLPCFELFNWKDRVVYIIYDSDAASNNNVMAAENALARQMLLLGAHPFVGRMPELKPGVKCGLDDYIAARGADKLKAEILDEAVGWQAAHELFKLNEEVVYVQNPGLIVALGEDLQRMAPRAFVEHAYATRIYTESITTDKGVKTEEKSAAREWLKWPMRAVVKRMTYKPGQDRWVDGELNTWKGWACAPKQDDVRPWNKLLNVLFGDQTDARTWFEQWLAYPLQHPGTKLYSAAVLWGLAHGTGKSLIGYTMFQIYGANATEIGDRDLHSVHNEWAESKQFVMADEITGGEKRQTADRMKSMITQKQLRLNPKYVPSYTVPDCINYYFTSNHPDSFFLEDNDRRFFIHEVSAKPMPQDFYKDYAKWLRAEGAAALFYHLLHRPLEGFEPSGHAPVTFAKMEMIDAGRSDVGMWCARLREDPDGTLRVAGLAVARRLWTTAELFSLYDPTGDGRVTANGLARELRRAGFQKVYGGRPIPTETGGLQRLWAIREAEKFLVMDSPSQLARIYDEEIKRVGGKKDKKF